MAWALLGVSNPVEVTATSHALVTTGIAGTLQAGDLLVACISSRIASTTSVTLPAGWTLVSEQKNNNTLTTSSAAPSGLMAYCVRGASNPALTFTHPVAPSVALGQIVAYRDVTNVSPKDTQTSFTTAINITSVSGAGLTTTAGEDLIVAMACGGQEAAWSSFNATSPAGASGATVTTSPAATWKERADNLTTTGADTSLAIFDAIKTAAGATGNLTVTASVAAAHVVIAGAFRISNSGTGTPSGQPSMVAGVGTALFPGTQDAWSSFSKTAGITLSNSDRTATATATSNAVPSTTRHLSGTAGKFYAELVFDTVVSSDPQVGLCRSANSPIYITSNTVRVLPSTGEILKDAGTVIGSVGGACVSGDVIGLAWDAGAERIWFRKNSGLWNNDAAADPATGTNGIDVSSMPNEDCALWMRNGNAGAARVSTVRAENADFTLSGPSGFTSWMGETLAAPAISGTGTPAAQASDTDGLGVSSSDGSGTPASQASAVSGEGTIPSAGITGTGIVVAQASDVDGISVSASLGVGAAVSQASTASGAGVSISTASGVLAAQAATAAGVGLSVSAGVGVLVAQSSAASGVGVSASIGSGAANAQTATVAGSGAVASSGVGVLVSGVATVAGAGVSSSAGTGSVVAGTAAVAGDGSVAAANSGALVAQSAALSGEGVSSSVGGGAVAVGAATIAGAGLSASTGSGALTCSQATVAGVGVVLAQDVVAGVGTLVAGAATIEGAGEVSGEVAPPIDVGGGGRFYPYLPLRLLPVEGVGALVAGASAITGAGVSSSGGVGALVAGAATIAGVSLSGSAGSSALECNAATITGAGRCDDDEMAIVTWLLAA